MSEAAFVTIIGSVLSLLGVVSTALSAVIASRFGALKRDVALVKHEVKNDHNTNMRVENDERHVENGTKLDQIIDLLAWLVGTAVSNRDRLDDIEDTAGVPRSRRAMRLARQTPHPIHHTDIPGGTP